MRWFIKLSILLLLFSTLASAEIMQNQPSDVSERARQRSYVGGVDEDDLKVQDPLPVPLKKMSEKVIKKKAYEKFLKSKETDHQQNNEG